MVELLQGVAQILGLGAAWSFFSWPLQTVLV